jgi:predicted carbohydrate-binding protein with CBM5 and CBM33 domain
MFKSIIPAVALASVLAMPAISSAQSNGPVTREQVRADLVQLENAGYRVGSGHASYPDEIQAAEAKVAAEKGAAADGYGGSAGGSSAAGRTAMSTADWNAMYSRH